MFDLNELPDNDGAVGRASSLFAAASVAAAEAEECDEDEDVVVAAALEVEDDEDEREQVLYTNGNLTKIIRLLRDGEVEAEDPQQSFVRLDRSSSTCYSKDWQQPLGVASFEESEIDTDNEVTVAALDVCAILDGQCVSGLGSAVSLVMPTEPEASFGVSPRPEELGQRAESARRRPDCTNFHRLAAKWDGRLSEKRDSDIEDDLVLDSRQSSSLHPGIVSPRKGKRAREDESLSRPNTVFKLKRHARPTSTLPGPEGYHGAGPSLSMALDQDAGAKKSSFTTVVNASSKEPEHEAATSLSLGEASLTGFTSTGMQHAVSQTSRSAESNFGLSMTLSTIANIVHADGDDLDAVNNSYEDRQGDEFVTKGLDRKLISTFGGVSTERPFWQGQLYAKGFSATNVAAYCSEDLQSASNLWSLPQEVILEELVKIEEFLAAIRNVNVVEPLIQLRLLPDAAASNGQSFSSMVRSLSAKDKWAKGPVSGADLQHGWQDGSLAWLNGPFASAGSESVFVASLNLKQSKEAGRRSSAKLFLLLDSSCEAVFDIDREVGRKLQDQLDWSYRLYENTLFGFLSLSDDSGRSAESSRVLESKACKNVGVSGTKESAPVGLPMVGATRTQAGVDGTANNEMDKSDIGRNCEEGGGMARAELEGSAITDGMHPMKSKNQKEYSVDNAISKARARRERHSLRFSDAPLKDDTHKDRDLLRKDKENDLRTTIKDDQRYSHRSTEKREWSKQDRSNDNELDKSREKDHHSEFYGDLPEKLKSGRERIKEQEKEKQEERNHRETEEDEQRERAMNNRDSSAEHDKGTIENVKFVLEQKEKLVIPKGESHDDFVQQGKDNRKRARVSREDSTVDDNLDSEMMILRVQKDVFRYVKLTAESEAVSSDTKSAKKSLAEAEVGRKLVEVAGDANGQVVAEQNFPIDRTKELLDGQTAQISCASTGTAPKIRIRPNPHSTMDVKVVDQGNPSETCDTVLGRDEGGKHEVRRQDLRGTRLFQATYEMSDRSHPHENAKEGLVDGFKEGELAGSNVGCLNKEILELQGSGTGKFEDTEAAEPSPNLKEERTNDVKLVDVKRQGRSRASLSVHVDNLLDTAKEHTSDDSAANREQVSLPAGLLTNVKTPISIFGADASQTAALSSCLVMGDGLGGPSSVPSAEVKEVSCEVLLEGCDKETRVWLVSKQNTSYLSGEFGVRISRLEEIANSNPEIGPKTQQGAVNVRVFLATEKSTDAVEAKWFISQAADVLRAVSSRGVFAKCLWYQGPVQRYAGDRAPSIQVIVRRIKGEDGKSLERIQEETGVMIGIVLDASNKKGIVNSARVIGLRLKCIRKAGFVEATKQVEHLLAQVAEQFSQESRVGVRASQDISLLKLKVDIPNNASPSSGIQTPMQTDVVAAYSPVSPVAAISPLGSFKFNMDEPSCEARYIAQEPTAGLPDCTLSVLNVSPAPASLVEVAAQSHQSEDEQPDNGLSIPDSKTKCARPLFVSNLPERASALMLRGLFEDILKEQFGLPSSYNGVLDMILDVRLAPDKFSAFVEFASEKLLLEVLKIYADNRSAFFGLKLELGSSSGLAKVERMFLAARTETSSKGLDCGAGTVEPLTFPRLRSGRKGLKSDDHPRRVAGLRSSTDSDIEVLNRDHRHGGRDAAIRFLRLGEKPKPLFLTELMRNASPRSIHNLFEDIIKKYINPALGNYKGRVTVLDVRYIPSRGCAFVDLATPELVEFMLDLHSRRPEVFCNMKMEIGRRPVPLGQGEEELVVKRSSHLGRNALVEASHSYSSGKRVRRYLPSDSPPLRPRRHESVVLDHDFIEDYDEDDDDERQPSSSRRRRSDPERTVYADRLPENASEGMIRRIFERVLRDNMTEEQRGVLGEQIITEVRYVPTKFCAFVVFVAEELTRLVLQLYNQDEEIFENMRLKPHFHSRMEDLYREDMDIHERDDGTDSVVSRDISLKRRSRRHMEDYQNGYSTADIADLGPRGRTSAAHRAVAATAFKEVDRRRSVYVDRIPERVPEPAMRDLFERALRQNRHGYGSPSVSQVTFFRDKFDPDKLCAFVELDNEDLVQELLDVYAEDEDAFSGMRVRPAVKYGH